MDPAAPAEPRASPAATSGVPEKPRVWPVFAWLVAAFGATAFWLGLGLGVLAAVELRREGLPPTLTQQRYQEIVARPWGSVALLWVTAAGWVVFALLAVRASRRDLRGGLALRSSGDDLALGLATLVGMMGCGEVGVGLALLLRVTPGESLAMLAKTIQNASGAGGGVTVAGALVLLGLGFTGFAEELFFRGFMQTRLVARWRVAGVILTAGCFALVHWDKVHSVITFGMGLLLGWVATRAGSIRPGVLAHVVNNLAAVVLIKLVPPTGTALDSLLRVALGAVALALAVVTLRARLSLRALPVGESHDPTPTAPGGDSQGGREIGR
jgi:membrane protease YdiL (CAAX protease family)